MISDPIVKRIALRSGKTGEEVWAHIQARWYRRVLHRLALWLNEHSRERRW